MKTYFKTVILFSLWTHAHFGISQSVEIKNIELSEGKVEIAFNLNDSIVGRYYTVRLYSSEDNFLNPLTELSGDVGMEVPPGAYKKVIWHAQKELGSSYNGKIGLELRARVYVPFINVDDFKDIKTMTRHRRQSITWSGGRSSNILNFNLYRKEDKITTFSNIANVGHHDLELPAHIKPGKGYYFLISDIKNKDEVVRTSEFRIKRKVPLLLKVVPVFGIAGAATLINPSSHGGGGSIPDPILPSDPNLTP